MNPVVGLDVAKGESQVQAFLDKSKPYRKRFSMILYSTNWCDSSIKGLPNDSLFMCVNLYKNIHLNQSQKMSFDKEC
ncbi:hypothetical protein ACIQD3_18120 [Peribacillus loiseleuriae]|uniref:hypothetical protein n=1 Tax=Peribacillus loiseleuriae TaxID=1679170 RepID=UPI0037F9D361